MSVMASFHITEQGAGRVTTAATGYHLGLPPVTAHGYHNAQISTYIQRDFTHQAPVRFSIRAHVEGQLHGTAGFGFWNHPYDPNMKSVLGLRLPRACWFFHSTAPNHMPLALDVPGNGWKCATFDALNWRFMALLPFVLPGFLVMRNPALYRRLWPIGQAALGVSERLLPPDLIYTPHLYALEWYPERVRFLVDDILMHETNYSPQGPLGFVAWVDNQFAVVTPQGRFGAGMLGNASAQALMLEDVGITGL